MTRKEAESLIGTRVLAWTAANGCYVGTLAEIVPHRPWRGKVLITGVANAAQAFEFGQVRPRRGFRPGEMIEVGGINISSTDDGGMTYLGCLQADLGRWEQYLAEPETYPRIQLIAKKSAEIRREQIEAESKSESQP